MSCGFEKKYLNEKRRILEDTSSLLRRNPYIVINKSRLQVSRDLAQVAAQL